MTTPTPTPTQKEIIAAITNGRSPNMQAVLDAGADANWKDSNGRTFLHFAALNGRADIVDILLKKGAVADIYDHMGETPADAARIFGFADIAKTLDLAVAAERKLSPTKPLPFKTLAEMRTQPGALALAVRDGRIKDVAALALATGENFIADDFLAKDLSGKSLAFNLASKKDLEPLMNPALWVKSGNAFARVWSDVPHDAKADVNYEAFASGMHQMRLKAKPNNAARWTPK